jgi:guanylate kinase
MLKENTIPSLTQLLDRESEQRPQGTLIILTGPTGAGKDAVMERFLEQSPNFKRLVTYATRDKRFLKKENRWEQDGVDYHFRTKEQFEEMIANGEMIEWVEYDGGYKGTSRESLQRVLTGENIVWRIDTTRAGAIAPYFQEMYPSIADNLRARTKVVYIGVDRLTILYDRFRGREANPDRVSFRRRIREEWQQFRAGHFDAVIINRTGRLQDTVDELRELSLAA